MAAVNRPSAESVHCHYRISIEYRYHRPWLSWYQYRLHWRYCPKPMLDAHSLCGSWASCIYLHTQLFNALSVVIAVVDFLHGACHCWPLLSTSLLDLCWQSCACSLVFKPSLQLVCFQRRHCYDGLSCTVCYQGCPQDVKSQDRDETETFNLQDRDVPKNVSRPRRSRPRLHPWLLL